MATALDSYEVIHHLLSAIKIVRPQLDGDGRYIIDAATRIAEECMQEDEPESPGKTASIRNLPMVR